MTDSPSPDPLLAAAQLTGADLLLSQLIELVATKERGAARVSDPIVRERLDVLRAQFGRSCAQVVEKHLGREQALQSLVALESAPLQQFLAARRSMAPMLAQHLQTLRRRIAELEL
ncbi:MAG: hypothetical protein ABI895_11355 [Deltaproteobacteria bacterium]